MIVNGTEIAARVLEDVRRQVAEIKRQPHLMVFTCAPNFETRRYLNLKKKRAEEVGIILTVKELPADVSEAVCIAAIEEAGRECDGIVVQLPFPLHIRRERLIEAIPASHDVDAFSLDDKEVFPPVVGAMKEILAEAKINVSDKRVVVVGSGKLVGEPAARWFRSMGAEVQTVTEESDDIETLTSEADIIILGAGSPGLLTPDMIQEGAVILDAGTSEEGGELKGDADPACAEKASLFTPVPGGIGPITIAILFKNLVTLTLRKD